MPEHDKTEKTFFFAVEGMACASCVQRVEKSLRAVPHVTYASVNLATAKAYIIGDAALTAVELQQAVKKTGYALADVDATDNSIERQFQASRKTMLLALLVTIPVMALMALHMAGIHFPGFMYVEAAAGAFTLAYIGRHILKSAWIAVSHFHVNMDTLIAIGAVSSYATTILALAGFNILSFGSIAMMLVALHVTGRYIESTLKRRAAKAIHSLLALRATSANVLTAEGAFITMPIETVNPGAELLIRAGERIPLDGTIFAGEGYCDESMINGESAPVYKQAGSTVIGGTVLTSGIIKVKVDKTGSDTFLAQMVKLVEEAQSSKVPIQAFADRITGIFIPVVLILAVSMALAWFFNYEHMQRILIYLHAFTPWINPYAGPLSTAVFVFVATLVIACPCALGLATPMALITGSGLAAKHGLILKNGEVIQKVKDIDIILLDKTGTITEGRPAVIETDINDAGLAIIASLEKNSTHPLASAITAYAVSRNVASDSALDNIKEIKGSGISGTYQQSTYFCGKPSGATDYSALMEKGYTIVAAYKDGVSIGFFAISDPIKPKAHDAIKQLRALGIKPIMLTGDNHVTAQAIAKQVAIDEIVAGAQPLDKVREVQRHQMQGKITAMVGDGVNDAAALKSADIGIAIGTGTDLAIESGDIIIIQGDLAKVLDAIAISTSIFQKITQNLFWAFFYNLIAIPLAMLGILHPAIAEIAMTLSSITVIVNSMRIRRKTDV